MTIVIDASALAAALVGTGPDGIWAESLLTEHLVAPNLIYPEVTNVLRIGAQAGDISDDTASLAYADLMDVRMSLVPYGHVADRVWELRHNVTPYDAWYVAVAETFDVPLATLDERLSRAPGPRCAFMAPTR